VLALLVFCHPPQRRKSEWVMRAFPGVLQRLDALVTRQATAKDIIRRRPQRLTWLKERRRASIRKFRMWSSWREDLRDS
jgi:hypothetical protein